ncbi:glutathione S-transferase family protein [Roseomonas alkaliterrae]|uniref:Glutathione S-transferase n=1 Tax=Neoroseomonas alkaliterrae TaxID=1452450 RepID=A0A840XYI1_9PROT|nr:glutathione S-transferase family protein [Neoroseomonas alkaliterrae]MBB5691669.1 glutathione S-transferase [Neoroseomonas alkaliterrae]MBR0676604.1 glutathione S-transferase family protein [Neoroseomonas alkaliterrae]
MLKVWGRVNSVNVKKVLWMLEEIGAPYERTDAGLEHGVVDTPEYRAMNPNGRIPTIEDGGFVLWESNSILRYLAMKHGSALYPADPAARASADRWMDWQLSTLSPAERNLFWGMVRTPPGKRDMAAVMAAAKAAGACWSIVDAWIARHGGPYLDGRAMTIADIVLGCYARRWFGEEVRVEGMPHFPALADWYARLGERPGFARWVAPRMT